MGNQSENMVQGDYLYLQEKELETSEKKGPPWWVWPRNNATLSKKESKYQHMPIPCSWVRSNVLNTSAISQFIDRRGGISHQNTGCCVLIYQSPPPKKNFLKKINHEIQEHLKNLQWS